MLETTARQIADLTGGELVGGARGDETVTGIARIDSREVRDGDLFAAFAGEQADGHDYLEAARAAGATLALVSTVPEDLTLPAVRVSDVQEALAALARAQLERARRENPQLTVLAITGSAGKTGTKDLLGTVLASAGETIAPVGSFNNELGLPLTVLRLTPATRFLVLEMGARGIGHIAHLTAIARPDVALVLNVGSAHLGEFGSVEAIAQAKGELVEALEPTGRAVLAAEDHRVAAMAERTNAPSVTWGFDAGQVRGEDLTLDDEARIGFTLQIPAGLTTVDGAPIPPGEHAVRPDLLGEHQAGNVLAALTAAISVGVDPAAAAAALQDARLGSGHRMQVHRIGGAMIIDDAYNANPDSMRQALKTLAHLGRSHRTIAVLGEMLELGEESTMLHDQIGRLAVRLNISQLYAVGSGAAAMHHGASLEGSFGGESELLADVDEAIAVLQRVVQPGDVVLVKSSRDAGLRRITAPLLEHLQASHPCETDARTGEHA